MLQAAVTRAEYTRSHLTRAQTQSCEQAQCIIAIMKTSGSHLQRALHRWLQPQASLIQLVSLLLMVWSACCIAPPCPFPEKINDGSTSTFVMETNCSLQPRNIPEYTIDASTGRAIARADVRWFGWENNNGCTGSYKGNNQCYWGKPPASLRRALHPHVGPAHHHRALL